MSNPLVSIIIPTYNRANVILETLKSVLSQEYANWECLIVDDGSTDNTYQIVNDYCKKNSRFKFFSRPKSKLKGANSCRNYGFELSKGDYIQFLDSDDLLSSNKLNSQIQLAILTDVEIITCKWGRFTNTQDFKIKDSLLYQDYNPSYKLLIAYGESKSFLPAHTFLIKKAVLLKSGLWNETLKINQDGEFLCRVISEANTIAFDENSHVKYRFENNNKTSDLSSAEKASDLTKSWQLIANYLITKDEVKFKNYIDFGKKYTFDLLRVNFKKEILKNLFFYRIQLKGVLMNKINLK